MYERAMSERANEGVEENSTMFIINREKYFCNAHFESIFHWNSFAIEI